MGRVVVIEKPGDLASLIVKDFPNEVPQAGEVLIKQLAIGLNHADIIALREGSVFIGHEACGTVESIGEDVRGFNIGDRVAYISPVPGAYREYRCVHTRYVVKIPQNVSYSVVAATFFKCYLAHTLTVRVFVVRSGMCVLVHDIFDSTNSVIAQYAHLKGAQVVGTVSADEQKKAVEQLGYCSHIINYNSPTFIQDVLKAAGGRGIYAVYDGVGLSHLLNISMNCLVDAGIYVAYDYTGASASDIPTSIIRQKSLFFTIPDIFLYKSQREENLLTGIDALELVSKGTLKLSYTHYTLAQTKEAIEKFSRRRASSSFILINDF